MDEQEPVFLDCWKSDKAMARHVNLTEVIAFWKPDEVATVVVCPVMEFARETTGVSALVVHHECPTVTARVHHGHEGAALITRRDHGHAEVVQREEGTGLWQVPR